MEFPAAAAKFPAADSRTSMANRRNLRMRNCLTWRRTCGLRVEVSVIRAATLYIVFALAGTPAATDMCIAWCDATPAGSGAATCLSKTTGSGVPVMTMRQHGCDTLPMVNPFLREDSRQIAGGPVSNHAVNGEWHACQSPALDNGPVQSVPAQFMRSAHTQRWHKCIGRTPIVAAAIRPSTAIVL